MLVAVRPELHQKDAAHGVTADGLRIRPASVGGKPDGISGRTGALSSAQIRKIGCTKDKGGQIMDKIKELLEKLRELVIEESPDYTTASFSVNADGYLSISVVEWEKETSKPVEKRKRRELVDKVWLPCEGKWTDGSEAQNDYYKKINLLLEENK